MVRSSSIRSRILRFCILAAGSLIIGATGMTPAGGTRAASSELPIAPAGNQVGNPAACTSSASAAGTLDPFQGVCTYLSGRQGVVQVALFDPGNGITYLLSNGNDAQYTASIVKVNIMAQWLHDYQQQGTQIPGGIPFSIRFLMQRNIQNSDNSAATALFFFKGGCRALTQFHNLIPLTSTTVGCETPTYYGWGNTTTTAADQTELMKILAYGGRDDVLGGDARSYQLQVMQNIQPDQRFGITCGPWGTSCSPPDYASPVPGVTVALKNGWKTVPTCTMPIAQCPWQVNSTGWVSGEGRNYVLTVLTTDNPVGSGNLFGFHYGVDTIQNISELIWSNLGQSSATPTPVPSGSSSSPALPNTGAATRASNLP